MDQLSSVAIEIESASPTTGNVLPLLHELRHALQRFQADGTEHCIDLNSLPMAEQDYQLLDELLGSGEIRARLHALGDSEISETRIPGIWRVMHFNTEHSVVGRFLEITGCPAILKTPQQDLADGVRDLQQLIDAYS